MRFNFSLVVAAIVLFVSAASANTGMTYITYLLLQNTPQRHLKQLHWMEASVFRS